MWKISQGAGRLKDDTVVTTVMSNLGLYKSLEREGMKYEQTAVGDKYVAENMMENGYSLGGEQSGHIIFSRYAATGDGILTSLMVMEACVEKKATLCDLARENEGLSTASQKCPGGRQEDCERESEGSCCCRGSCKETGK